MAFIEARRTHSFQGVSFSYLTRLSHLLFVDDVLISCCCVVIDCQDLKTILTNVSATIGMIVNEMKSTIYITLGNEDHRALFTNTFSFEQKDVEENLKYMGYAIKPNKYDIVDWSWLVSKVEHKVNLWFN